MVLAIVGVGIIVTTGPIKDNLQRTPQASARRYGRHVHRRRRDPNVAIPVGPNLADRPERPARGASIGNVPRKGWLPTDD